MAAIKTTPDQERARNIYKLAKHKDKRTIAYEEPLDATIIIQTKYDVIKELLNAHFLLQGYKPIDHKELIEHGKTLLTSQETALIDQLRKLRNNSNYQGEKINPSYLQRNQEAITSVIETLKRKLEETIS